MLNNEELRRDANILEMKMHELSDLIFGFAYKYEADLMNDEIEALGKERIEYLRFVESFSSVLDNISMVRDCSVVYGPEPSREDGKLPEDIELK